MDAPFTNEKAESVAHAQDGECIDSLADRLCFAMQRLTTEQRRCHMEYRRLFATSGIMLATASVSTTTLLHPNADLSLLIPAVLAVTVAGSGVAKLRRLAVRLCDVSRMITEGKTLFQQLLSVYPDNPRFRQLARSFGTDIEKQEILA